MFIFISKVDACFHALLKTKHINLCHLADVTVSVIFFFYVAVE